MPGIKKDSLVNAFAERSGLEPSYPYNDCLTSRLNETNETV